MQPKVLRANLTRQIREQGLFDQHDHVLVAVSGGQDSLHLLRWLTEGTLPADVQPTVSAGYVNHQLRDDAAAEEALVRRTFAATPHLAHGLIETLTWEAVPTVAVEERAREKRYEALIKMAREVGANIIVTAHHQGDQVETILYKLTRGSRLTQLVGMAPRQQLRGDIDLARPLLDLTKADLADLVIQPLTEWVEDYTNADETFARNRMRQTVLPALTSINEQAAEHVVTFATQLAALQKLANGAINVHVKALEAGRLDWTVDESVLTIIIQTWLTKKHVLNVKDSQIAQAIQLMRNPSVSTGLIDLGGQLQLERFDNYLLLSQKH